MSKGQLAFVWTMATVVGLVVCFYGATWALMQDDLDVWLEWSIFGLGLLGMITVYLVGMAALRDLYEK